jgi:hypothetical protein
MKALTRRRFLATTAAAAGAVAAKETALQIGTMDGVFKMPTNPDAVALAKKVGFAGVQVTLGRPEYWRVDDAAGKPRIAEGVGGCLEAARYSAELNVY